MSSPFTQSQSNALDRWLTTPPSENDDNICPDCDSELEKDGDGWECTNPDCNWSWSPDYYEDDYEGD